MPLISLNLQNEASHNSRGVKANLRKAKLTETLQRRDMRRVCLHKT